MLKCNASFFLEKLTACFGDLVHFEQKISQIASLAQIDLQRFNIDHLAVRVNQRETAEYWREQLLQGSTVLKESTVNGRLIGLFELNEPIVFFSQPVSIIELPFPKDKFYAQEGWEHIEVVYPFQSGQSVEEWVSMVVEKFTLANHPQLTFKISQPKVVGEQLANPTIAIFIKNVTSCNNCCLKIHPYDIKAIVNSENVS